MINTNIKPHLVKARRLGHNADGWIAQFRGFNCYGKTPKEALQVVAFYVATYRAC